VSRPVRLLAAELAILTCLAGAAFAAAGWSVEIDGEQRPIASRRIEGVDYLSAADLAAAFGGRLREERDSGSYVMEVAGLRVVISGREGLVSVGGRIQALKHPNRIAAGALWVGPDFVTTILAPAYPRSIQRAGRAFVVGDLPPVAVTVRTLSDAAGTRAVLEFSHPVPYEHAADPAGLRVRVPDLPLIVQGAPAPVQGDAVIAVWYDEEDGGGTFRFEAGPAYGGAHVSEMSEPFRIVVDFDRKGGARLDDRRPAPGAREPRAGGIRTVVLDPGHGGGEVGAEGPTGLHEKDVVLDIARRVARLVRQRLGLAVLLTRDADQEIPLDERAGIANNRGGDLFVSIHANAARGSKASGAETYFLAMQASDEASESVAARENRAGAGTQTGAPGGDLEMILWDLAQSEHRIESFLLAETIQRELNELLDTRDRGVRQAPFRVLMGVTMPAVLVEVAFISNPQEEAALRSEEFKERIAEAIAASIGRYKASYEERIGSAASPAGARGGW
jgi:N-acetylmuramoyl-L-alanine amidase